MVGTAQSSAIATFVERRSGYLMAEILGELSEYDFLGFDIAQTETDLRLIEVNRSPQFKRYNEEVGVNIAMEVIRRVEERM